MSEKEGYSHFFYGSTEATLGFLEKNIRRRYPKLKIAGVYSPPFRKMTKEEDEQIVNMINETKPDFVWVGLGAPKQEPIMHSTSMRELRREPQSGCRNFTWSGSTGSSKTPSGC